MVQQRQRQAAPQTYQALRQEMLAVQRSQQRLQQSPRPLKASEKRKAQQQVRDSTWDGGVIAEHMARADVVAQAWDLPHGCLLLWIPNTPSALALAPRIALGLEAILAWFRPTRPITTLLWWRDDPRQLGANEWAGRRQVNGGWTVVGSDTICVYRAEEWDRVVFHELIHALEMDALMPEKPLACWGFPAGSRIQPTLFEAWTELLAEWFWCAWWGVPWDKQLAWSRGQALQLLARRSGNTPWREDTSVFAYYVLKAALAPHMERLLVSGIPQDENALCGVTAGTLQELREAAKHVQPGPISLRMSYGGGGGSSSRSDTN